MCFFKEKLSPQPLQIDGNELEPVSSHKVLGLVIQSSLKWNEDIDLIISKASKRLHILRVRRRGGVPPKDLLLIYFALIRSVLEYCCVLRHHAIPLHLTEEVERVQKRAFRIILPSVHYKDALRTLDCLTLAVRRANLCLRTIKNICKVGDCLAPRIRQSTQL